MLGKIFTSKNNKIKIFRVFRVFEYALGQKMRSWKRRKIAGNYESTKIRITKGITYKLIKNNQKSWYVSTSFNTEFILVTLSNSSTPVSTHRIPPNIYCLKSTIETVEKGVKYVQS